MESPDRGRFEGPKEKRIVIDDLAQYEEEEIGVGKGIRERKKKNPKDFGWLKNLFVALLLVGIVVGSFWISYLIGKKMLVPVKPLPKRVIPTPSITPEEVLKEVTTPPPPKIEVAKEETKAPSPKPAVTEKLHYYKVQAGVFKTKTEALSLAKKLDSSGFPTFVRKLENGMWRVQVGAFKTRNRAEILQGQLKTKGYSSTIIYE